MKASAIVVASGNTKLGVVKKAPSAHVLVYDPSQRIACVFPDSLGSIDFSRLSRSIMRRLRGGLGMHPRIRRPFPAWLRRYAFEPVPRDTHRQPLW